MLTKIDICSQALLKIGEQPITSFSDDNPASKISSTLYDVTLDSLLARHTWNFATNTIVLKRESDGKFTIPADVLRIIDCDCKDYEIDGGKILCDYPEIEITSIVRVAADKLPAYFISLLTIKLAMEFCVPLTGNQNTFALLNALFAAEFNTAKFIDSSSAKTNSIDDFSLISTRF